MTFIFLSVASGDYILITTFEIFVQTCSGFHSTHIFVFPVCENAQRPIHIIVVTRVKGEKSTSSIKICCGPWLRAYSISDRQAITQVVWTAGLI